MNTNHSPNDTDGKEQRVQIGLPNKSRGPLILGLLLIFVGIYFLLERYDLLPPFSSSWPVLIVIAGGAFVVGYFVNLRRR